MKIVYLGSINISCFPSAERKSNVAIEINLSNFGDLENWHLIDSSAMNIQQVSKRAQNRPYSVDKRNYSLTNSIFYARMEINLCQTDSFSYLVI